MVLHFFNLGLTEMGLVLYKARRLCVSHDMKTKRILLGLGILALLIAFVWWRDVIVGNFF